MASKKKSVQGSAGLRFPQPVEVDLASVNFAPYNPRTISPQQMKALKASLEKHGVVLNLVVQKQGMTLIGGHQRVRAVRELCAERGWPPPEKAWATVLDVSDSQAKQLNVALNNIEGEFDPFKLGELFSDIAGSMTIDDIIATGFEPENIDELVRLVAEPEQVADALEEGVGELSTFAKSVTLTVEFETTAARDEAKALLWDAAKERGCKAGTVALDAVKAMSATKRRKKKEAA